MGKIFGNLSRSAIQYPGAPTQQYYDTPQRATQAASAQLPSADSMLGPDVLNPNPTAPALPKVVTPTFSEALDRPGALTNKGGVLSLILSGISGAARGAEIGAMGNSRTGFPGWGASFGAGFSAPFQDAETRMALRHQQQDELIRQQQIDSMPSRLAAQQQAAAADLAHVNAQTRLSNTQADALANKPDADPNSNIDQMIARATGQAVKEGRDPSTDPLVKQLQDVKTATLKEASNDPEFRAWQEQNPGKPIAEYFKLRYPKQQINVSPSSTPITSGATPDQRLSQVPAQYRALVQSIVNYQADPARVTSMRGGHREQVMGWVYQVDPSYDMSQYASRAALRKDFNSGKGAANIRSLNTAIGHLDTLRTAGQDLNNSWAPALNAVENFASSAAGKAKLARFNAAADAVTSEMANVFKGSGATDQEIKAWRNSLSPNMSPAQLDGSINQMLTLMGSRMDTLQGQYSGGMGRPTDFRFLNEKSRKILTRLGAHGLVDSDTGNSGSVSAPSQAGGFWDSIPGAAPIGAK